MCVLLKLQLQLPKWNETILKLSPMTRRRTIVCRNKHLTICHMGSESVALRPLTVRGAHYSRRESKPRTELSLCLLKLDDGAPVSFTAFRLPQCASRQEREVGPPSATSTRRPGMAERRTRRRPTRLCAMSLDPKRDLSNVREASARPLPVCLSFPN